jgi:hypothetical protein
LKSGVKVVLIELRLLEVGENRPSGQRNVAALTGCQYSILSFSSFFENLYCLVNRLEASTCTLLSSTWILNPESNRQDCLSKGDTVRAHELLDAVAGIPTLYSKASSREP